MCREEECLSGDENYFKSNPLPSFWTTSEPAQLNPGPCVLGCTNFPVRAAAGEAQTVLQLLLEQYIPPPTL